VRLKPGGDFNIVHSFALFIFSEKGVHLRIYNGGSQILEKTYLKKKNKTRTCTSLLPIRNTTDTYHSYNTPIGIGFPRSAFSTELAEKIVRKRERAKGHGLPFEIESFDLDFF
jgi:hypothetical protein